MDYMDPYSRRYPGLAVQPFTGQQHAPSQGPQYPYWNPLVAYYQQQHRAGAMMGQGGMQLSKPAEPKPRLAKDEVEMLEREFAKNQKPSSSTKRELAEQMGVEVPRINVRPRGEPPDIYMCVFWCADNVSPTELVPESPGEGETNQKDGRV
jgi:hypothetical protein